MDKHGKESKYDRKAPQRNGKEEKSRGKAGKASQKE
jgi:hypothetical protein